MPAGTGVWVVKTVPARTASTASGISALVGHQRADALEAEEAGVTLVGVEHLGRPQGFEGADPADAEEDLLAQAVLGAPAVEAVGDPAQ